MSKKLICYVVLIMLGAYILCVALAIRRGEQLDEAYLAKYGPGTYTGLCIRSRENMYGIIAAPSYKKVLDCFVDNFERESELPFVEQGSESLKFEGLLSSAQESERPKKAITIPWRGIVIIENEVISCIMRELSSAVDLGDLQAVRKWFLTLKALGKLAPQDELSGTRLRGRLWLARLECLDIIRKGGMHEVARGFGFELHDEWSEVGYKEMLAKMKMYAELSWVWRPYDDEFCEYYIHHFGKVTGVLVYSAALVWDVITTPFMQVANKKNTLIWCDYIDTLARSNNGVIFVSSPERYCNRLGWAHVGYVHWDSDPVKGYVLESIAFREISVQEKVYLE